MARPKKTGREAEIVGVGTPLPAKPIKPRPVKKPHAFGPATSALKPLGQRFVEIMQTQAHIGQAKALRLAGHKGSDMAVTKAAYRLMRDPTVLEAFREAAVAQVSGMVPRAVKALDDIMNDPKSRHHYKAIDGVLSRAGLPQITEHKTTVVHKVDRKELVASIATMVEKLGIALDSTKLLPQQAVKEGDIIEAEYSEREE
jgi:hypothetical protein